MKKVIREVNNGIVQITIVDERWYIDNKGVFVPSSTWISSFYPKGVGFYKWLAETGWDEAEEIKVLAGERGSKVHQAITDLIGGQEVRMDSKYINPSTGVEEELTADEYDCVVSFKRFFDEVKPRIVAVEITVFNSEFGYAGTIDIVCEIEGEYWILDVKTGQSIWPAYELQLSSYKHAYPGVTSFETHGSKKIKVIKPIERLGIIQVGYKRNKNHWKLTEVQDKFGLFLACRAIWQNEVGGVQPVKIEYPESVSIREVKEQGK